MPTFAESGIANFFAFSWAGIFASSKTPAALVARVNGALNETLREREVQDHLTTIGIAATPMTPDAFESEIRREYDWYEPLLKKAGIHATST